MSVSEPCLLLAAARYLAFLLFACGLCLAQFSGSIQGVVQDPAGAGVPKASITLVNTATTVTAKTTSDGSGNYRFVSLAPGSYKISATASGFSTTDTQVTLTTGENLNVPMSLSLASAATAVEVTGTAPVVDTGETRNQQTIQSEELSALPIAGRNMVGLVTLAPGVSGRGLSSIGSPGSAADNFSTEQQVDASANGRSSNANMFVVDGLDVTSNIRPGVLNLTPNPDSVQEATTAVNTYSVEYGRGSSLVYTMTTKSGTDQFHGLVSDYFTYESFWAGTEFSHSYQPFHSNNISANIGGPIVPHHQLFFFFGIEPLRSSLAAINTTTFEDPQFVAFAQSAFPNTLGTKLLTTYKPSAATTTGVAQTASQAFGSGCGTAADAFIPCNLPVIDNGVQNSTNYRNGLQYNVRVDKYFSNDRLYGNFFRTTLDTGGPNVRPAFNTTSHYVTNSFQANETHTFSPTTLNEASFAFLRVEGISPQTGLFSVPSITVNGVTGFGDGFALGDFVQHNYHWRDVLTHIQGSHSLRFGYDGWHGDDLAYFAGTHDQPSFSFNNLLDLVEDNVYSETGLAYNPVTGKPAQGNYGYQSTIAGLFAEDTWKAKPNVTVTYGLRWDDFGNPYVALQGTTLANFHLGSGQTFDQQIASGFLKQQNHVLNQPIWNVWSPRIGVAWDPSKNGSWVVRGGFGMYHDMPTLGNMENGLNSNPPGFIVPTFFSNGTTAAPIFALGNSNTIPFGFPYPAFQGSPLNAQGGIVGSQAAIGGVDVNLTAPTTFNYSFTVEHKLIGDLVASLGYAGSNTYNLITGYGQTGNTSYGIDANRFAGDLILHNSLTPTRLNQSFGAINYAENAAEARYDALVANVRGRFGKNIYFNASYTHSRSLDDTQVYPTYGNLSQYYSPSAWDTPDRFSLVWNYQFPSWSGGQGLLGHVLSGWSISGTSIVQNGNPFTVYTTASFQPIKNASGQFIGYASGSGDYNADGVNLDYPNVSTYKVPATRRAYLQGVFAPGIITQPAFGSEGNEKPNQYRNPAFIETDASLLKDTRIFERINLQLRFEFYNIFNHPNLNGIDSNLADGTFGTSTGQAYPRWIQVGAKITF
jgi:Carboxypeptidase regulatory-like domain